MVEASPVNDIPAKWRLSFDNSEISGRDLSWADSLQLFSSSDSGELSAQAEGKCVSLEFNSQHAAVLYLGNDGVILRPYFSSRSYAEQDVSEFFCKCCGVQLGDIDEYLSRFLLSRSQGMELFKTVLATSSLPRQLPDTETGQSQLPGFDEFVKERSSERELEWRPLPPGELSHA
jgi:hypothetical protein